MQFSDSHCHLDSFPQEELDNILEQIHQNNISSVLTVSINLESSEETVKIKKSYENVFAAVGFHPNRANELTFEAKKKLERIITEEVVAAIGEIGLDYTRPIPPALQQQAFKYQLSLATDARLPVNIHYSTDASQHIIDIIKKGKMPGLTGIVHDFRGDMEILHEWLDLGFYVSLGKYSLGMEESDFSQPLPLDSKVVRAIPLDRLLTETDAMAREDISSWKNLARQTYEGEKCPPLEELFRQPLDVIDVAGKISKIRGISVDEIGSHTTQNLKRILRLD